VVTSISPFLPGRCGEIWPEVTLLQTFYKPHTMVFRFSGYKPTKMAPTWRNGRAGTTGISKRLDRFLLEESLIGNHSKIRSWIINSTILDHNLICLQLESSTLKFPPPFKFNTSWITDLDFTSLIKKMWHSMENWSDPSSIQLLCAKLKNLKKVVVLWQRDKKTQLQSELHHIEVKMAEIFEKCLSQVFVQEDMDILKALKQRKELILSIEESTWRLRSRAIWLNKGDKNTKFFHKFATQRRSQNTIWDIVDDVGVHQTVIMRLRRSHLNILKISTVR
jgi:hypothetical protein